MKARKSEATVVSRLRRHRGYRRRVYRILETRRRGWAEYLCKWSISEERAWIGAARKLTHRILNSPGMDE